MSRRDNAHRRCPGCRMRDGGCVCALVPRLSTRTRVILAIHAEETRKTTGTGLLAARCLANSAVVVVDDAPPAPLALPENALACVLADVEGALLLDAIAARARAEERAVCLVVPDGTWRQARKLRRRIPGVDALPVASLPPGPPTEYRLRGDAHDGGLATLEAVARALAILEDDGEAVAAAMMVPFRAMVARTLETRGVRTNDPRSE